VLTVVLGSATGGGFTQWDCSSTNLFSSARCKQHTTQSQFTIAESVGGEDALSKVMPKTVPKILKVAS